ncbi:NAD(P)-dependent oxidoreductase [Undibacterium sp. RTI2.1]|uniref:NAD(P)-dependent oxidoreductase n=1 Tax=unclassified Undibacterium TaxID=2630295 RepID=UPI002AB38F4F|nr:MULTISPECIES: NAD(P)-dependent oxidoreductase [unclassified Undibacterium]MDY7540594.1 NAD(P)-dependent oxidoreductase [Undibacterium sp. 5I1]MEB0029742.1 NAD(P)-dependent oxidoreductase [Undibacterium sp. RTI2.1]MEB0117466.1 NAD(P)-dependent oxidoreductase [Undibacterium sp. RTI2.2]MEB0230771.1 NAD(P)-dependent oxidoreductase [Undibacterium sp. 10I3]MEB0256560.1 NAD(P)-dependent oxidoreductase [Undibacterium sp. 5I1]
MIEVLSRLTKLEHLGHPSASKEELAGRFTDLVPALTARQALIESQRCLYCYDAPCTRICPSDIDVASFIRNIANENINGAAKTILQENIFGGSCSRVCPTEILCEQSCVRNHDAEGQPVKIGLLQRHAIDNMQFGEHPFERATATGRTVAVVGAGPAGLSCAHRLAMLGNDVVVFESRAKAGGLNEYGIAKYKLPEDFAQREVEFLLEIGGITIQYGQTLGGNLKLSDLRQQYDAVFLALGLGASRELGLTGEDAAGLLSAVDYIAELRQVDDLSKLPLASRCLVIGAGNTAIDMAVQMARLGADDVTVVYRRGAESMSATGHEQDIAKAHQVRLKTWAQPQQILLDETGRVRGVRFEKTRMDGARLVGTGESFDIAADAIFKAIGQALDAVSINDALAVELEKRGDKVQVDDRFRTSVSGVYAGGDCVAPGQDLTVQAVQHGKLAAAAIHQDLLSNSLSKKEAT